MSLLHRRIGTIAIMALFLTSGVLALVPSTGTWDSNNMAHDATQLSSVAESSNLLSVAFADRHYGAADGIIDPWEYASNYTDPVTGISMYMEHNGTNIYLGLAAQTSGWIGVSWQNYTESFTTAGLNNSDLIIGYAPGTPSDEFWRAIGTDSVTVHYILTLPNGTILQENDFPDDASAEELANLPSLAMYRESIFGMRIGEVRHFIIPAKEAYTDPTHDLYGLDLEYEITLTRITREGITRRTNPADKSQIVYSDEHGVSTLQHIADANQDRILSANASDDGVTTQVEYIIPMDTIDSDDIPLLNSTDFMYPFLFMFSNTEDMASLPVQRTHWSKAPMVKLVPNAGPTLIIKSPLSGATLSWIATIEVNATDNTRVKNVQYRLDDEESWNDLAFNQETTLWEARLDLTNYEEGAHTIWFNATDLSNATGTVSVDFNLDRPFIPLLGMRLDVDRTIGTESYMRTSVKDKFTVTNNGSSVISAMEVYLPMEWESHLLLLSAKDQDGIDLEVVRLQDLHGMLRWRIHFAQPVNYEQSYILTTTMQMHSLYTMTDSTNKEYEFTFLKFPVAPYVIRHASLEMSYRTGDSQSPNYPSPDFTASNLAPLTIEEFINAFRSYTPHIVADRTTVLVVNPWGWLSYKETIHVDNIGLSPESLITFTVPAFATNIKVYDRVGLLVQSQLTIEGEWNASRQIGITLLEDRFGPPQFLPGYSYEFNIEYVVQINEYEELAVGGSLLDIPFGALDDILIKHHRVDLVLPYSVNTLNVSGEYRLLHGVFETTLTYNVYNTTNYNPIEILLLYQVSPFIAARPLALTAIVGLLALAYVSYRGVRLDIERGEFDEEDHVVEEQRQTGAPPELLRQFANLYSKKTALNMDLEKLEAARRRGKVKKREFMIRERDIKSQLDTIDSDLPKVKEELSNHGARYRDMVSQLELYNERIEGAKAGLRQLLLRKKKQRISRVAFEKSRQDYLKTIQKATSAIDRTLLTIQEEAGDI
ncbi:MAG: Ig-like domain-containing protein [Candidatus Thorarchaeota archaeon]